MQESDDTGRCGRLLQASEELWAAFMYIKTQWDTLEVSYAERLEFLLVSGATPAYGHQRVRAHTVFSAAQVLTRGAATVSADTLAERLDTHSRRLDQRRSAWEKQIQWARKRENMKKELVHLMSEAVEYNPGGENARACRSTDVRTGLLTCSAPPW